MGQSLGKRNRGPSVSSPGRQDVAAFLAAVPTETSREAFRRPWASTPGVGIGLGPHPGEAGGGWTGPGVVKSRGALCMCRGTPARASPACHVPSHGPLSGRGHSDGETLTQGCT